MPSLYRYKNYLHEALCIQRFAFSIKGLAQVVIRN